MAFEKFYEQYSTGDDDTNTQLNSVNNIIAQTFTVGNVGTNEGHTIKKVRLYLTNNTAVGTMNVEIRETSGGAPTGSILARTTLSMATIVAPKAWYSLTFTNPATVVASGVYALCISAPDATTLAAGVYPTWEADISSPGYTGGNKYQSTDNGTTWASTSGTDLLFQIIGVTWRATLCTFNDVIAKGGAGLTAGLASGTQADLLEGFALQAESRICAITRYNWIDNYATLNTDVKYILNEAASNLAGIYAIAYQMSGYTDRVEAETMINVLRDAVLMCLGLLRDQKVTDFIIGA